MLKSQVCFIFVFASFILLCKGNWECEIPHVIPLLDGFIFYLFFITFFRIYLFSLLPNDTIPNDSTALSYIQHAPLVPQVSCHSQQESSKILPSTIGPGTLPESI